MADMLPFQQYAKYKTRDYAIKAKCADCVGGPCNEQDLETGGYEKSWKNEIKECPITACPLHSFRPYQKK